MTLQKDKKIGCSLSGSISKGTFLALLSFWSYPLLAGDIYFNQGNVGIGTTKPSAALSIRVKSTILAENIDDNDDRFTVDDTSLASSGTIMIDGEQITYTNTAIDKGKLLLYGVTRGANSTTRANHGSGATVYLGKSASLVVETGRVGIGTTNPSSPLDVMSPSFGDATSGPAITIRTPDSASGAGGSLDFHNKGSGYTAAIAGIDDDRGGRIEFRTSNSGSLNAYRLNSSHTKMVIKKDGNVGIGTTSPTALLEVNGTAYINGNVGIGTTSLTQKLNVNGTVVATAFSGPINGGNLFIKTGNNGTASCDNYCTNTNMPQGQNWGTAGTCIGQKRNDTGPYYPCSTVVGAAVTCLCVSF